MFLTDMSAEPVIVGFCCREGVLTYSKIKYFRKYGFTIPHYKAMHLSMDQKDMVERCENKANCFLSSKKAGLMVSGLLGWCLETCR